MAYKAIAHFHGCEQISQDTRTGVEHLIARVYFSMSIDGKAIPGLSAEVRMEYGGDYAADPIQVDRPDDYKGPFNYEAFRAAAEKYYRKVMVKTHPTTPSEPSIDPIPFIHVENVENLTLSGNVAIGRPLIEIGQGVKNVTMRNNKVSNISLTEAFEISENSHAW